MYNDPSYILPPDSPYNIQREIGRGAFSIVYEAKNEENNELYAIKVINKRHLRGKSIENIRREIHIMSNSDHPNIMKLKDIFETKDHLIMVLDYMKGGELFEKIVKLGSYNEDDAIKIVRQILDGIKYLHDQGVAHRDLKPENLLCSMDDQIVISDFGLSKLFGRGEMMVTRCGTPHYAAPEVFTLNGVYGKECDMWSLGVITFVLLSGKFPFGGQDFDDLFDRVSQGIFSFSNPVWEKVSDNAKDFITKLLVVNPKKRMTSEQALHHSWLARINLYRGRANSLRQSYENLSVLMKK